MKPSQLIPFGKVDEAYDEMHANLEFAYKRAKVLADMLNIPVHESPEVTGTILGLVRGEVERLQSYFRAVDNALTCWEMVATGDAKPDLNKLLCIEQQVAVDPAVSDTARALRKQTAMDCIKVIKGCGITIFHIDGQIKMQNQIVKAIAKKFGLEI